MNQEMFNKQQEELNRRMESLTPDNMPPANIIVTGITGAGKSTLINAVFGKKLAETGKGRPVTAEIDEYYIKNVPVRIWDTIGFELDEEKTKKSMREIKKTIGEKSESTDLFDRIHAIWYCVNSGSNKYQGIELDFIKELYSIGVPFIIVMTQCIKGEEDDEFEKIIREINQSKGMGDIEVIQVLAEDLKTRLGSVEKFGLSRLIKETTDKLPEFVKDGFIAAQRVDTVHKRALCEEIIIKYVTTARYDLSYKLLFVNIFTTDKSIRAMLKTIGDIYNTSISPDSIKMIINETHIDFDNVFSGLINPIDGKYKSKVAMFLYDMREKDGFKVEEIEFSSGERAARMIAFYGYTFVMALEEVREQIKEKQLEGISNIVKELIKIINERLAEVRRGQYGK